MSDAPRVPDRRSVLQRAKSRGVDGQELLREIAFNQLLHRLSATAPHRFLVKGGQALRARAVTDRSTADLDVRGEAPSAERAVEEFLGAAAVDISDGLTFQLVSRPTALHGQETGGYPGFRVALICLQGAREFMKVSVDIVAGRPPSGMVQSGFSFVSVGIPELIRAPVDLYPIEDHIADKVWATMTTYGGGARSSRARDLFDLAAIALVEEPQAAVLAEALELERMRRGLPAAASLDIPQSWRARWSRSASTLHPSRPELANFESAVNLAAALVDPVLTNAVRAGFWSPRDGRWATP